MKSKSKKIYVLCYYTYEYAPTYVVDSVHFELPTKTQRNQFILEVKEGQKIDEVYNELHK